MTSSLVGSEMCIRDRKDAPRAFSMRLSRSLREIGYQQGITDKQIWRKSVSYTHLTLPTICSV
eukprot:3205490-Prorocentrum_lima.AAC.1